jgi:superfamily II DNA or RNA helicase
VLEVETPDSLDDRFRVYDDGDYSNPTFPPPRPHQVKALADLRKGFRDGHKKQVLMAPTGAGKTYLGLQVIHEALKKGSTALFVCDRITLIDQASRVALQYGLGDHGVIQATHWRKNRSRFQIGSVQTLARRGWPKADVVVVDECHTMYKSWTDYVAEIDTAVIGLSATPFSPGLGKLFSNLVNASTTAALVKDEVLVPLKPMSMVRIDMEGAEIKGGEWTAEAAAARGMEIIGDVVDEWVRWGENRKTIVFGATKAHCTEMARRFNNEGIAAATFTEDTKPAERAELLRDFADGTVKVLISVECLAKGFDQPDVGCICDVRPLRKSLSTFVQLVGRGLRCAPGKVDCILLDFSGNIQRFARDFEDLYNNGLPKLKDGDKLDKTVRDEDDDEWAERECPQCGFVPFIKRCMRCGFERVAPPTMEYLAGKMTTFDLLKLGGTPATALMDLWLHVSSQVKHKGNPDTLQARAAHLFKSIAGVWPPFSFPAAREMPMVKVSSLVRNQAKANLVAWIRGKNNKAS